MPVRNGDAPDPRTPRAVRSPLRWAPRPGLPAPAPHPRGHAGPGPRLRGAHRTGAEVRDPGAESGSRPHRVSLSRSRPRAYWSPTPPVDRRRLHRWPPAAPQVAVAAPLQAAPGAVAGDAELARAPPEATA